jgi:hypothetical protein
LRKRSVINGFLGFTAVIISLDILKFPFRAYITNNLALFLDQDLQKEYAHPISILLKHYLIDLVYFFKINLILTCLILILVILLFYSLKLRNLSSLVNLSVLILAIVVLLRNNGISQWTYLGYTLYSCTIVALALQFFFLLTWNKNTRKKFEFGFIGALSAISPIMAGFGTSNPILGQMCFAASLMLGVFALNLEMISRGSFSQWINRTTVTALLLWSILGLINHSVLQPYNAKDLRTQTFEVVSGPLRGISLDQDSFNTVNFYQKELSLDKKSTTIAIDNPMALFLTTNDSFANPWINYTTWPASFLSIRESCKEQNVKRMYIFIPSGLVTKPYFEKILNENLTRCDVVFPDDFRFLRNTEFSRNGEPEGLWLTKNSEE